jgi:ParB family transcriptional regulator, chromosome partitioning protein
VSKILKTPTLHYVEEVAGATSPGVTEISLEEIDLSNTQFEYRLDPDLALLIDSIKKDGQQIPVIVRGQKPPYQLICGFRRARSIREIGGRAVKAIILQELSDDKAHRLSVLENEERKSLTDLDRANACKRLQEEGKTQEEIGRIMNRSAMQISRYLSLLALPPEITEALKTGKIETGHALELRGIAESNIDVKGLIEEIKTHDLSVRDLQRKLKNTVKTRPERHKETPFFKRTKQGFKLMGFSYHPDLPAEEKQKAIAALKEALALLEAELKGGPGK